MKQNIDPIFTNRNQLQDNLIAQMAEPEILRALKKQKQELLEKQRKVFEKQRTISEAENLRKEIRRLGGVPCR